MMAGSYTVAESDAASPAITTHLHVRRHWRGVADPGRSPNFGALLAE